MSWIKMAEEALRLLRAIAYDLRFCREFQFNGRHAIEAHLSAMDMLEECRSGKARSISNESRT